MKHLNHTDNGLTITYELEEYMDELDDKAHRRQKRREWLKKLHLLRVLAVVYLGVAAACALVFGLYRAYLHLQIFRQAKRNVSIEVIDFAEKE